MQGSEKAAWVWDEEPCWGQFQEGQGMGGGGNEVSFPSYL